ncbi:PKD domain-containing protein [Candidatus Peregrinibacteria bacterium]|jgi:PKD repeat protein|nr:PKD domain-containing protein [Candidatus Peregrinibacteria bacterium]MBT3598436.1 PKD domain-containing protein [Candidatus Peregrinibacteria bacterium]MBT6730895.1 PKD domain-containing protein [Candidatus Peregrinibacteria bacterium]MBT7009530.1 PKD domain-containing protein [Candidatus Peregrinibacteria bacterium]MBT7344944.1 PKD domain-containing protein [Candidatus Peregrinibacteria bacterium]
MDTNQQSVDGISVDQPAISKANPNIKMALLIIFLTPYVIFVFWCLFLLAFLPNAKGDFEQLIPLGVMSGFSGAAVLSIIAAFLLKRIVFADKQRIITILGVTKISAVILPGIIIALFTVYKIQQEPSLSLQILAPEIQGKLIAPLTITFGLNEAADVLSRRGLSIESISWDFEGDGEANEETIETESTAYYEDKGTYDVAVKLTLTDGSFRYIYRKLLIADAVFSVFPIQPIVDEPVTLSIEHMINDPVKLVEAKWDFQSDGEIDEITDKTDVSFTYPRTGLNTVTVTMLLSNQTLLTMQREITITDPPPLPFPVSIETDPINLIGPAPFGILFSIETSEPFQSVDWDLGDGNKASGDRIGHTFEDNGNYYVTAEVRSNSGVVARVSKTVRVVDVLRLPDLKFVGTPDIRGRKISGEVPLQIEVSPETNQPLIDFVWEAPNATAVESTDTVLKAIYRRPGTYTATMIATGPSKNVLRMSLTIEVLPPSSIIAIRMSPEGGVSPLLVRFDASETVIPDEEITGFEWKFGDGIQSSPIQSGAQIEYLFEQPGTYRILVTAFTTSGKTFSAERTIVVRAPVLDACFTTSRTSGKAPLGVSFDMSCTTGRSDDIEWDFGDGSTTDENNPIHVFERPGTYNVILSLKDEQGSLSQEMLTITSQ